MSHSIDFENYRRLGKPISVHDVGLRIDRYLAREFLFRSRTGWHDFIQAGEVLVNGKTVKPSYSVLSGDEVCYFRPLSSEPEVDKNIVLLWEKDGVFAIYKPSNLPMHEGGAYRRNTFCEVLKEKFGPEFAPTHRLDRETSGIVLCSDRSTLRYELSEAFFRKKIAKKYLAMTLGRPNVEAWDVDQPIAQTQQTKFRIKYWVLSNGQPSQTHFKVLNSSDTHSFVEVTPKTGRTHQIRVHSAWSGFPLVGDKKYFPDESIYLEYYDKGFTENVRKACLFNRLCLHATYLRFTHPIDKKTYEVTSDLPKDLHEIWLALFT